MKEEERAPCDVCELSPHQRRRIGMGFLVMATYRNQLGMAEGVDCSGFSKPSSFLAGREESGLRG